MVQLDHPFNQALRRVIDGSKKVAAEARLASEDQLIEGEESALEGAEGQPIIEADVTPETPGPSLPPQLSPERSQRGFTP